MRLERWQGPEVTLQVNLSLKKKSLIVIKYT
jgi:hypothetical protein